MNKILYKKVYDECYNIIDLINDKKKKKKLEESYKEIDKSFSNFYSITFELRMYKYLCSKFLTVIIADDNVIGPDFKTDIGYIECVSPTMGISCCSKDILKRNINRYEVIFTRLTSVIKDKTKKYIEYIEKKVIDLMQPCIIAIDTSLFSNEFHSDLCIDAIEKVLYGIGDQFMIFRDNKAIINKEYEYHIYNIEVKKGDKSFYCGYFLNNDITYNNISAVILCNNSIGEKMTDQYFHLFINPSANVKVDISHLKNINFYYLDKSDDTVKLIKNYK